MSRDSVEAYLARFDLMRERSEVMNDLDRLFVLVVKWQRVQNLVSRETPGDLWHRHILDSLQLLPLLQAAETIVDLGSGGGFPSLPLAVVFKEAGSTFNLVESNGRKVAFLNAAKRELQLPVIVHNTRIESHRPISSPDVVTARALASLAELMDYVRPVLGPHTRLLFHKGRDYREELAEVDSAIAANVVVHPSLTAPDGVILEWPAGTVLR